jgi:ABC-type amino acid transport substrate-binding protein
MQRYLQNQPEYDAYLTPDYARFVTGGELELALVRSLTPEALQTAYGANPPIPIVPPLVEAPIAANAPSVLDAIASEGVLRVAIPSNTLPFGFTNDQGQSQGYCVDLMEGLAAHLTAQLGTPIRTEVVAQPTVTGNFEAVRSGAAMVECGPNSIRLAAEGITFSSPFFITGTHFLVREGDSTVNPSSSLEGVRIGVKDESATERFLEQRYPTAAIVDFQGPLAQQQGIQAMFQGQVDAFAGDGILLLGEAIAENLPANSYRLIPDTPLSCEPYGLVLPGGDRRWEAAVNSFIASPEFRRRTERLFTPELYSYILLNLDFCAQ